MSGPCARGSSSTAGATGPYPYATVTLVDPAPGATGAGGMEYPTLFTAGTHRYMPAGVLMPEMVTIHEFGHGYWYGMVGSNEFEEAWLDEGINTYSEIKAMDPLLRGGRFAPAPGSPYRRPVLPAPLGSSARAGSIPFSRSSWDFVGGMSYATNVYAKAGLMLLTLERYLGEDVMARVMQTYYERWKFRHPTSEDFIRVAEAVSGRDLDGFFDQFLRSPGSLDYAVSSLSAVEIAEPRGLFDAKRAEPAAGEKPAAGPKAAKKPAVYRNNVVVARHGDWVFPQELLVTLADGRKIRETWDGKDRWKRFVYDLPVKAASAQLDPDRKLVLDVSRLNDSRTLAPSKAPVRKASLHLLGWLQGLLTLISM